MPPRGLVSAMSVTLNLHLVRARWVITLTISLDGFSLAGLHQIAGEKVLLTLLICHKQSLLLDEVEFQDSICLIID